MRRILPFRFFLLLMAFGVFGGVGAWVGCDSKSGGGKDRDASVDAGDASVEPDGEAGDGGGGGEDAEVDAATGVGPERSCLTEFRFSPEGAVGTVELAGEWDWNNPEAMQPDGNGDYVLEKDLAQGLWAYKLIVDDNWILDPDNAYRKYDDGVENSGMRVPDCHIPLLVQESFSVDGAAGTASATVSFYRAAGGSEADPDTLDVTLRHGDFTETAAPFTYEDQQLVVDLSGLDTGKYTLVFEASDADGNAAKPIRIPFWVEPDPFDWEDAIIYMVMLDRFRDGNTGNTPTATAGAAPTADWHGGDLAGITAAIQEGYFDTLGVQALWVSPWLRNPDMAYDEHGHGVTGYHGYWPIRARELDPRFGTEAELQEMVTAAHEHGIRILMDFVINHVHEDHEHFIAHPEYFRTGCKCGEPGCGWTEHRLDCLFQPYLPDVNWEVPEAGETIISDALWWLETFHLDGLRVDAVKHVEDAAIFNLSTRVHETFETGGVEYFLLGETAMGWAGDNIDDNLNEYATISRYIGPYGLNGQFDFVLYHAVSYNVWAYESYGLIHADYWTQASLDHYPADAIMTPYIGSHDTQRFLSLADPDASGVVYNKWPEDGLPSAPSTDLPYSRLEVALAWVLSLPGAPLLYYGDEYGEFGGSDPDNRHMWRDETQRTAEELALFDLVAAVGTARRNSLALRRGDYESLMSEEGFLCFARYTTQDLALVVLNRTDAPITRQITLSPSLPQPTASLLDALRPSAPPVDIVSDSVTVTVPARAAVILLPN